MAAASNVRFIADVMVGKLARWLRVLGVDVAYSNSFEDAAIIRIALDEDRIILTRDTGLAADPKGAHCILIENDHYKAQLRQVLRTFDLKAFEVLTRCIECNVRLTEVDKETVFERVPPYIYLTHNRFALCPSCNRVYWHGTHTDDMLRQIRAG